MIDECILHIGTEKTGTTSIQKFLATNRTLLKANGVLYPLSPGKVNHIGLEAYAAILLRSPTALLVRRLFSQMNTATVVCKR